VKDVYTTIEMKSLSSSGFEGSSLGIVYACITSFEMDNPQLALSTKWQIHQHVPLLILSDISFCSVKCFRRVDAASGRCSNADCPEGNTALRRMQPTSTPQPSFDLRIQLSDHTGSLQGCQLYGKAVEDMLGIKVTTSPAVFLLMHGWNGQVEEYLQLDEDARTQLKWMYLLERCKIYIKVCVLNCNDR
jgi:hypothetical protein